MFFGFILNRKAYFSVFMTYFEKILIRNDKEVVVKANMELFAVALIIT